MLVTCAAGFPYEHQAQEAPATAPAPLTSPENELKMSFVSLPNTPVLFASHEVTVKDFQAFLEDSQYEWNHPPHFPQTADHPAVNITLPDAIAFCEWFTQKERKAGRIKNNQVYRLPTNEEWSIAVGLTSSRKTELSTEDSVKEQQSFPWGIEWPPPAGVANLNSFEIDNRDDGYRYTAPVGLFKPSKEGVYDLAGNVWEWTWNQSTEGTLKGLLRGGSWMYFRRESLLSSYEYVVPADLRAASIGFRCVFEDKQQTNIFLANVEKVRAEEAQRMKAQFTTLPKATAEEIEAKRKELMNRNTGSAAKAAIDPKSLKPALASAEYQNSVGAILRPLAPNVLIAEKETTIEAFEQYLKDQSKTWQNRPTFNLTEEHPIMNISWVEAKEYCAWLTKKEREYGLIPATAEYRLPTDSEWSLAVGLAQENGDNPKEKSGKNNTDYPWGNEWPPPSMSANLDAQQIPQYNDRFSYTAPVGTFSPNALHLYDLSGNVSEWCEDVWPEAPNERVIRGSSWIQSAPEAILSSTRQHADKDSFKTQIGFRVVLHFGS